MTNKIKVLVADEPAMQLRFKQLFESNNEAAVVEVAATAEETIRKAKALQPDIILLDLYLPDMDGFATTEILSVEVPFSGIILMGSHSGHEDLRKAMLAGAKDYIVKPFPSEELFNAINLVYASTKKRRVDAKKEGNGKVITVFSPRGGIGKTTLATNLACALASKSKQKVVILDCNMQFGDVALALNITPKASIVDMVTDIEHLNESVLMRYMVPFNEDILILPAPFQPEQAENITAQHLAAILKQLQKHFPFTIVDTASIINDLTLTVIDMSDILLIISAPDITTTKNVKLSLQTLDTLGYPQNKIVLVLNRANSKSSLIIEEVEDTLNHKFLVKLPSDGELVVSSVNRGIPFVISNPNSPISRAITDLARKINANELNLPENEVKVTKKNIFGTFKRMFFKSVEN